MTTCRAIIKRALQKLAIIAPGDDPEASEAETGLAVLQGMFDGWASSGMFGRVDAFLNGALSSDIVEWILPEPSAPVELPIRIRDSNGDVLPPRDLSFVEYVDEATGERRNYLFDARRGAWLRIDNLTFDTDCPLARRNVEGLAAVLAVNMADDFGVDVRPLTLRQSGQFLFAMSAKYSETRREGVAEYF